MAKNATKEMQIVALTVTSALVMYVVTRYPTTKHVQLTTTVRAGGATLKLLSAAVALVNENNLTMKVRDQCQCNPRVLTSRAQIVLV